MTTYDSREIDFGWLKIRSKLRGGPSKAIEAPIKQQKLNSRCLFLMKHIFAFSIIQYLCTVYKTGCKGLLCASYIMWFEQLQMQLEPTCKKHVL